VDANSKYLYIRNKINNINGVFSFNVVPLENVQIVQSQAMFCYILGKPSFTFNNNVNIKNEIVNKYKILEELIKDMDIKYEIFKKKFKNILNSYAVVI